LTYCAKEQHLFRARELGSLKRVRLEDRREKAGRSRRTTNEVAVGSDSSTLHVWMSGLARRVDVARLSAMNADSAGTCAASRQVSS